MAESENETLKEIQDPVARAKLAGIQEAVFSIDADIVVLRRSVEQKQGVIAAAQTIASRLAQETKPVQEAVDTEKMAPEEGQIRVDVIRKLVDIVNKIGSENQTDLLMMRGQITGMERAIKRTEERFNGEAAKYERWQRVQAEEAANDPRRRPAEPVEEPPQPAPEVGQGATQEAGPGSESTEAPAPKQKGKPGGNVVKQKGKKPS